MHSHIEKTSPAIQTTSKTNQIMSDLCHIPQTSTSTTSISNNTECVVVKFPFKCSQDECSNHRGFTNKGNMNRHIRDKHPTLHKQMRESNQIAIQESSCPSISKPSQTDGTVETTQVGAILTTGKFRQMFSQLLYYPSS